MSFHIEYELFPLFTILFVSSFKIQGKLFRLSQLIEAIFTFNFLNFELNFVCQFCSKLFRIDKLVISKH